MPALLCADTRIGTCQIDKGEDRMPELFGKLHRPQGLAIAFRIGLAEAAGNTLLQGAALQITDHQYRLAMETGHAGRHRAIVAKLAVAMDLTKIREQSFDVVHGIGPLWMASDLGLQPRLGGRLRGCGGRSLLR